MFIKLLILAIMLIMLLIVMIIMLALTCRRLSALGVLPPRALAIPLVGASRNFMSVALPRPPLLWAAAPLGAFTRSAPLELRTGTRLKTRTAPKQRSGKPRIQKLKSHHGARKRFKMRADGRWTHWRVGRQHLQTGTSSTVRLGKRKPKLVRSKAWQRKLRLLMPYGCRFTRRRVFTPGPMPPKTSHDEGENGRLPRAPKPPKPQPLSQHPKRVPGYALSLSMQY